jgi:hypothetical protein
MTNKEKLEILVKDLSNSISKSVDKSVFINLVINTATSKFTNTTLTISTSNYLLYSNSFSTEVKPNGVSEEELELFYKNCYEEFFYLLLFYTPTFITFGLSSSKPRVDICTLVKLLKNENLFNNIRI